MSDHLALFVVDFCAVGEERLGEEAMIPHDSPEEFQVGLH